MPTVDISSLLTNLNPIRQSYSYTMPVLSPRHTNSSTLTGSYRSTFSSSSISRPYYSSTPRITSYSDRISTKSYTDETKKIYSRHASIVEDGISRCREESREKSSLSRESIRRESSVMERDLSLTRSNNLRDSRMSTLTTIDSVADLRNKYSPANYVPAILRKDNISRSKSINDIGRSSVETKNAVKTKKVTENVCVNGVNGVNGVALPINNTNKFDDNMSSDNNGNRASVAEIRKKFDINYTKKPLKITENDSNITNTNTTMKDNKTQSFKKTDQSNELLVGGNKLFSRPAKYFKINDLDVQDSGSNSFSEIQPSDDSDEQNSTSTIWDLENVSMDTTDGTRNFNHTSNFASYIPAKNFDTLAEDGPSSVQIQDLVLDNTENNITIFSVSKTQTNVNDISTSTSPRLNRSSISQVSSTGPTSVSGVSGATGALAQRASPSAGRSPNHSHNQGLNGLKNIGNTCFMNSVIQCLSNTRYLLEYVRDDSYLDELNTTISSMKGALIKAFSQVIQELWSADSSDRVVNTLALKSQIQRFAPRFMGYAQQDAQEFLRYLLEGLHEDVNRVTIKPASITSEIDEKLSDSQKAMEAWHRYLRMDNSRVVDIFVGQLKSTLRCTHCGHCSVTFDPFWDLSLPIPQRQIPLRLSQCLEHFTREETLDGDEKPTCSKCKERRKCTKSFSIHKFPRILVIHLKRFSPTERFRGKLNVVIDFPLQGLDLSPFASGNTTDCVYNLYAVSNHSGTTYSGHYTAYCKHPYSGQWHEYNDSRVSSISPKNVVSSEAYVLFYELVSQHSHL